MTFYDDGMSADRRRAMRAVESREKEKQRRQNVGNGGGSSEKANKRKLQKKEQLCATLEVRRLTQPDFPPELR